MPDPSTATRRTDSERPAAPSTTELVSWGLYDWASNSYATVIQTFVFAAYFTEQVARNPTVGTAQWGLLLGVTGFFIAIGGPLLGATIDQSGRRKPWIFVFTLVCVTATGFLWFVRPDPAFLWLAMVLIFFSELGVEYAGVLYNAMLPTLVPKQRLGRWSGWGWGMGYAGGLLCLIVALLGFVREENPWWALDREQAHHVRATFPLAAAWFLTFSLPLFAFTSDTPSTGRPLKQSLRLGVRQLRDSLRDIRQYANIVRFLIARLIYIDGLATLFVFGGVYAAGTFGMTEQEVLTFGIALNVSAGLGAVSFAWIDDWIGARQTIVIGLIGLIVPGSILLIVESPVLFWTVGIILGIFVGPVQAAARSYLGRVAPEDMRNQMFGLYALSGKVAFFCPLLVGLVTFLTGSQRIGMSMIIIFFTVGLAIMLTVEKDRPSSNGNDF